MSRLPNDEWLHLAKGIAVGSTRRVRHGREGRDNMIVFNNPDSWGAYCQRCKRGAREEKTHVAVGLVNDAVSRALSHPQDDGAIGALPTWQSSIVTAHLTSKNMDLIHFCETPVTWSPSRQRLLLHTRSGLMGRDTSGRSAEKWLTYDHQHFISDPYGIENSSFVILTEDCYSQHKVRWALGRDMRFSVYCTLGTKMHDSLLAQMLTHGSTTRIASFYDGDAAGLEGCSSNLVRLFALGLQSAVPTPSAEVAPHGFDPKDMATSAICAHVQRLFAISN